MKFWRKLFRALFKVERTINTLNAITDNKRMERLAKKRVNHKMRRVVYRSIRKFFK